MNNGGDAAEQVVRLSLEGFEVAAKLTGSAAKNSMWRRPAARSLLHLPLTVTPESSLPLCSTRLPLM